MLEKIKIILQYLLPKKWITYLAGLVADWKGGWVTHYAIKLFIHFYNINLKECSNTNLTHYKTFNDFFTRKLNINSRLTDTNPLNLIIPADGIISQIGIINQNHLFHIKGANYYLEELLAGHDHIINHFHDGSFIIIYIPPENYHRIHMPCTGILKEMLYIPGELFSVHPKIIKKIPHVLSKNEKIICLFNTNFGYMAQILVGSTIVGSIETSWSGKITPPREGIVKHWHYPSSHTNININQNNFTNTNNNYTNNIKLSKGEEMGLFKLGSTVINLFCNNTVYLNTQLQPNDIVRIGMPFAQGKPNSTIL